MQISCALAFHERHPARHPVGSVRLLTSGSLAMRLKGPRPGPWTPSTSRPPVQWRRCGAAKGAMTKGPRRPGSYPGREPLQSPAARFNSIIFSSGAGELPRRSSHRWGVRHDGRCETGRNRRNGENGETGKVETQVWRSVGSMSVHVGNATGLDDGAPAGASW